MRRAYSTRHRVTKLRRLLKWPNDPSDKGYKVKSKPLSVAQMQVAVGYPQHPLVSSGVFAHARPDASTSGRVS